MSGARAPTGAEPDPAVGAEILRSRIGPPPEALLVLGSGLGTLGDALTDPLMVPFETVPGLAPTGVEGHAGRWIAGSLGGRRVLIQSGRFHYYEGHPSAVVTAPVRIAAAVGIRTVFLTNAAGGIRSDLEPGTVMLLDDHVNFMARSPLAGPVHSGEERFPDMSAPYDVELQHLAMAVALQQGIPLQRGTYCALLGPSYETPAEIRMLARLGVDAVGMSTVPEVIAARASGLRVLAFSVITNRAAGLDPGTALGHGEVMAVARRAGEALGSLIQGVLEAMPLAAPDARAAAGP